MILVYPMPDEYMPGHMARFAYINGFRSLSHFITDITAHSREDCKMADPLEIYQRCSMLLKIDQNDYLEKHSMMPIDRIAAHDESMTISYGLPRITHQRSNLLKLNEKKSFCSICAEEDMIQYGFSYWRRTHQIHGVTWCIHHGFEQALMHVTGETAYDKQPHHWINKSEAFQTYLENPILARYVEISIHLLDSTKRYTSQQLASVISSQQEYARFILSMHVEGHRISDLCRDTFPIAWLQEYFPSVSMGKPLTYCPCIDGTTFSIQGIFGPCYVLALSAVFDTPEAAFSGLSKTHLRPSQKIMAVKNHKIRIIWRQYFLCSGSPIEIVKSTGFSISVVIKVLLREGLPALSYVDESIRRHVLSFLQSASDDTLNRWRSTLNENRHRLTNTGIAQNTRVLSEVLETVLADDAMFTIQADVLCDKAILMELEPS